ncbi:hypothetical protein LXL04_021294 [Taraxacum kok-saghyz]
MKQTLPCVLLLLFIIATTSLFSSTTADQDVKDSTGNKVLDNVPYRIGPVTKGGQIKLTDTIAKKKVCPFNPVQDPAQNAIGSQFRFTMPRKTKYLRTSSVIGIDSGSSKLDQCNESTFWTVPDAEAKPPSNLITTGGGFDQAITCFQIVGYPKPTNPKVHSYMLQHCPSFCGAGPSTCFNISIHMDNGVRRFSTTGGTPFEFVFYKV